MTRLCAVLVGALVCAGSAGAMTRTPFPGLHPLKLTALVSLEHGTTRSTRRSCLAHARKARTRVARFTRKIAPVACEQPPRSKVRDAGSSIVLAP